MDPQPDAVAIRPVAVLINTEAGSFASHYGWTVKHKILSAILTVDDSRTCRFATWWGTLDLPARRPTSGDATSLTLSVDSSLLWSSAVRLVADAEASWALPVEGVSWLLGRNYGAIYVGVFSGLPDTSGEHLHKALIPQPWYLGSITINPTDALHNWAFGFLNRGWWYADGWVYDPNPEDHIDPEEMLTDLPVEGFGRGPHPLTTTEASIEWAPNLDHPAESPGSYQETLIDLVRQYEDARRPLTFAVGRRHPTVTDLESKLRRYALDPTSKKGAPKARFFATVLGSGQDDWRLLAIQLIFALHTGIPAKFRDESNFGKQQHLRFETTGPVIGLNGRIAMVTAAWKVEDDGPVQLVTVTPGKKRPPKPCAASEPKSADSEHITSATGDLAGIYAIACVVAEQARRDCRPTPVVITGEQAPNVIMAEGAAGRAWVNVPARSALADWLVAQGHAHRGDGSITQVTAPGTFYEPALAWANGFATVMQAAGHDCAVTYAFD
ncbi:DUF6883 domain-containing protein [Actinoplanes sp. NPDC049596]|uniref:DUF6883 domain-containing protein n=1 Tax=unclassified Actinoplanes TaxID=2626549 RepID=UPI00342B29BD